MVQKKRVLILQNEISSYNISTYNLIANELSLTVGYFEEDKSNDESLFEKQRFETIRIGPFIIIKGLREYCDSFDVVCILPNLRIISYCLIPFFPHHYKVISWGIGFRCSYSHPYLTERRHTLFDRLYKLLLDKCDANIFYMEKSKEFWKESSLKMDRVFVAPNTTDVLEREIINEDKRDFLFVGSLYRGKGLDLLLEAFKDFKDKIDSSIKLVIVGGGEMEQELKEYVKRFSLGNDVLFTGPIFKEEVLSRYYASSLLCFSPTQAGLSVPKSMGYGVPFVTRKDAITGGELYHITNGVNGILYSSDDQLVDIMVDASINRGKYVEMGRKAKEYYRQNATINHKAQGLLEAVEYVLSFNPEKK